MFTILVVMKIFYSLLSETKLSRFDGSRCNAKQSDKRDGFFFAADTVC